MFAVEDGEECPKEKTERMKTKLETLPTSLNSVKISLKRNFLHLITFNT
jgi:hypothetical protein